MHIGPTAFFEAVAVMNALRSGSSRRIRSAGSGNREDAQKARQANSESAGRQTHHQKSLRNLFKIPRRIQCCAIPSASLPASYRPSSPQAFSLLLPACPSRPFGREAGAGLLLAGLGLAAGFLAGAFAGALALAFTAALVATFFPAGAALALAGAAAGLPLVLEGALALQRASRPV